MQYKYIIFLGFVSFTVNSYAQLDLSFKLNLMPTPISIIPLSTNITVLPHNSSYVPSPLLVGKKPEAVENKVLVSPKMITFSGLKLNPIVAAKLVYDSKSTPAVPIVKTLEIIKEPLIKPDHVQLVEMQDISIDEYKMIQALLLFEIQKKYDIAMSLFIDLLNNSKYKLQALYHYSEIAYQYGLNSEFRHKMLEVMKSAEDKSIKRKAVESLVKNASAIESEDVKSIDPIVSEFGVNVSTSDEYLVKRAKYNLNEGDLATAEKTLSQVSANSSLHPEAKLLLSNINYRQGNLNSAIKTLEQITAQIENKKTDKIRNLVFLTLGRLYFQKGNYKQSYATYLKIDKSSPLWLQSTTEQSFTQILAGDNIGAAGNMFSLHTEYFKKAYAPETYIIRAVGYLNLCQYGDATSVIADLHRRYSKIADQVQQFKNLNTNSADYYNLVKDLFNNPDQMEIKGVPRAFIIDLARHPNFINIQKRINAFEEEITKFNSMSNGLTAKTQNIRQNIVQIKKDIQFSQSKSGNPLLSGPLARKLLALEAEQQIAASGHERIERMRNLAQTRMQIEKNKLKIEAGDVLQKRFKDSFITLTNILEQKDVLAYEIYSGAGQQLRYQMAGGDTKDRAPAAALTPEEKQSYKWKFKGEVWEDEIGHYRSSLTNVCPKDEIAKNVGEK